MEVRELRLHIYKKRYHWYLTDFDEVKRAYPTKKQAIFEAETLFNDTKKKIFIHNVDGSVNYVETMDPFVHLELKGSFFARKIIYPIMRFIITHFYTNFKDVENANK